MDRMTWYGCNVFIEMLAVIIKSNEQKLKCEKYRLYH